MWLPCGDSWQLGRGWECVIGVEFFGTQTIFLISRMGFASDLCGSFLLMKNAEGEIRNLRRGFEDMAVSNLPFIGVAIVWHKQWLQVDKTDFKLNESL